jgi:hypothetical protein
LYIKMSIHRLQAPTTGSEKDSTPTLAPAPETTKIDAIATDTEEQEIKGMNVPGAPFPDGGLRAWAAVSGAFLVCESSATFTFTSID